MNFSELEAAISAGESEILELKKSTAQLSRAGESLCALLNRKGGKVIIGVTPGGKIVGQEVSDKTLTEVANMLQLIEPPQNIDVNQLRIPDSRNAVIILDANPTSECRPFTFNGRPYQRIGPTTSVMPQERYHQLLLDRVHESARWENALAQSVFLDDLDIEEILQTLRQGNSASRLPVPITDDPEDILLRLGLIKNGKLVNAAVVLFGTKFLPDYLQCSLRMARFRGTDKTEFLDNRQIQGHAFTLLGEAITFLDRHIPVGSRITSDQLERIEKPQYPREALREALVNAICHRDYSNCGGSISLAIYDDRLEIWSDGKLPFDLKPEDLKRNHSSRLRNPLIANTFYRRGLIEHWGRGTQRIVELCVGVGLPEPEFSEKAGCFVVEFGSSEYISTSKDLSNLLPRQEKILEILISGRVMSLTEILSALDSPISKRTLQQDLAGLKNRGAVETVGKGRSITYRLRRN